MDGKGKDSKTEHPSSENALQQQKSRMDSKESQPLDDNKDDLVHEFEQIDKDLRGLGQARAEDAILNPPLCDNLEVRPSN